MAIVWNDILRVKRIESRAYAMGFELRSSKHLGDQGPLNLICVCPRDDQLPHYSREAELMHGTLEQIEIWLNGIEWSRSYDEMIGLSDKEYREKREQVERNRQLAKSIKYGRKIEGVRVGNVDLEDEEMEDE